MKKISHKITIDINRTTVIFGLILLALGYFIGNTLPIYSTGTALQPVQGTIETGGQQEQQAPVALEIPSYVPFLGSESATVSVVEFGDYQCPFCQRFFQQTVPGIIENYVDTGKARFYFVDFQFLGPDSFTLGQGAWCANDQGKYYEYHGYVYANQGVEHSGWGTPDKVKELVKNVDGIDATAFASCLDSKKYESRVNELTSLGQRNGVSGTPATFVGNSEKGFVALVGAQPYAVFQQTIDQYLQ